MVINILELVGSADTAAQGNVLLTQMKAVLGNGDLAVISFNGVKTATSSFVNASFVELLQKYTLEEIRQRVRVKDSTRQINEMIRTRLERESHAKVA